MNSSKCIRVLFFLVFVLSLMLRLSLATVNREANDDHLEVAQLILQTGNLPTKDECWECFQPKLYHATLATLFHVANLRDLNGQVFFANLVNVLASALTLLLIGRFFTRLSIQPWCSLLAFSFVALNPKFIGISAQATNDSFLILFSTLALFMFYEFLLRDRLVDFVLTTLFAALAMSAKTSGIVTIVAILLVLFMQIVLDPARRTRLRSLALVYLVAVLALAVVNPLNQYVENYRRFGRPVLLNIFRQDAPHFSQPTFVARPGIVSIRDGFLTFKLLSLLAHPRIEESPDPYPQHRTSLWTQLYARAHSLNFDNWPRSWSTSDESLFPLLRAIYLLALLPTGLILLGAFLQLRQLLRVLWRRNLLAAAEMQFGLFPFALWGYVAFVALYAFLYRDFSVMKAAFLFPALLAFPLAFLAAIENRPRWFYRLLVGISLPLLCLYVADVVSLILRLAQNGSSPI